MRKKFTLEDVVSMECNHYHEVRRVKKLHQSVYGRMNEYIDQKNLSNLEWASTSDMGYLSLSFFSSLKPEKVVDMLNYAYRCRT